MAKIMNVDYEAMPNQAKQMRAQGKELNNELVGAYKKISDMHNCWYGKRYNSLVKEFNDVAPKINELLELVVTDIPSALETVANNYSQADKGSNVTSVSKEGPKKITTISQSNDVGMKFLTSEVSNTQKEVSNSFKKSKEKMNTIEAKYGKIKWESEAADTFKAKFKKLKADIVTAFDNIDSQFTKLMEQTKTDIQNAENANTVK